MSIYNTCTLFSFVDYHHKVLFLSVTQPGCTVQVLPEVVGTIHHHHPPSGLVAQYKYHQWEKEEEKKDKKVVALLLLQVITTDYTQYIKNT